LLASRPGRWRPADPQLQKVQLSSKRNAFRNGASRRKALSLANTGCGVSARPRPALRRARYFRYVGKDQSVRQRGGVLRLVRSSTGRVVGRRSCI